MKILDAVDELVNQCLVEQSGLFEDIGMYLYRIPLSTFPGQSVIIGVNEGTEYFDAVWTVGCVTPEYLSAFQISDLL